MRVNIIWNARKGTGLSHDIGILRGMLTAVFGSDVEMFSVNHSLPECPDADFNVFVEVMNPSLIPFARKNIWIPNPEWTYRAWEPYLGMVDEVWCKTHEALSILAPLTSTPVKYIGWSSVDKVWDPSAHRKNYYKAFVPVGKNVYRHPKPIFQAYLRFLEKYPKDYARLPVLHVAYDPAVMSVAVPAEIEDKVVLHGEVMRESAYDELLKECGLAICLSLAEGFCHAVNEAMSVGCNLILSPIAPFKEDLVGEVNVGAFYGEARERVPQPDRMGVLVDTDVGSVVEILKEYLETDFKARQQGSLAMRKLYEVRHREWVKTMQEMLPLAMPAADTPYCLKDTLPKESDLPDVSVLTITHNRRPFMPLAKYCYMIQSYPEDKLEWIIVDDGDDPIEDTLIGVPNVTYIRCAPGMTIGQKRNLAAKSAIYDVMAVMDDDDVYPNNSVLQRAAMIGKSPAKACGFCTTIPCYDISQFSSFMNVPPRQLPMSQRVSEATLVFTRAFWEERGFEDVQIGEGDAFVRGREHMCREISPQDVIVSLIHPKNTSSRRAPEFKEPNGCHFGFNEKLFAMVSQIGEDLLSSADRTATASGGADRPGATSASDGADPPPEAQTAPQPQE